MIWKKIIYLISLLFRKKIINQISLKKISNTEKQLTANYSDNVYTEKAITYPEKYVISNLPSIRYQGSIGSCASHSAIAAYETQLKQDFYIEGSELFHYYNAREMKGTLPKDTGMTIREACYALKEYGYAFEHLWPYDINKFNQKPDSISYTFAKLYKVGEIQRLLSMKAIKSSLLENVPVLVGIKANKTFNKLNLNNYIYNPNSDLGSGHAVLVVGYDDLKEVFIIRNSWGSWWGNNGNFEMTYNSFGKYSFDWYRILSDR